MLKHLNPAPADPQRVVILGAGFVGSTIAGRLRDRRIDVLALALGEIDLAEPEADSRLAALLRPTDAVVAAAAVAPCRTPAELRINVTMVEALGEAVRIQPVGYLLNIGSDAVYADVDGLLRESSCTAPTSLHGLMHLARELIIAEAVGERPWAT